MKELLALSTLPREGPSVRPRVLAYGPALEARGISLRFAPFLSSRGFRGFYSRAPLARARKVVHGLAGYVRQRRAIAAASGTGVLVHREIVPRGNRGAVATLKKRGLRIAYDLDDAIYMSPRDYVDAGEASRKRMSKLKRPEETDHLIASADLVLAGNETIAMHARTLCGDVRVQPTPVDTETFRPRPRPARERPLVGWIGSPTATYCLKEIAPALERAAREAPFDLLVVGADEEVRVPGVEVRCLPWRLDREACDFASLDVGLYPLPDNAWTRGKCGMKALQYLSSEVAALVSPVGVNREIVTDGETGFHVDDESDWTDRLLLYLGDPDLRAAHGRAGREAVLSRWSLEALTPSFLAAMEDLLA